MRSVHRTLRTILGVAIGISGPQAVAILAAFLLVGLLSGCGTPGAPQAPSLRLPGLVSDLTAERAGDIVTLRWTMPRKTTDHLLISKEIHGPIPVRVCMRVESADECQTVREISIAQGGGGQFNEELPRELASGEPRELKYFVELKNKPGLSGRSAGLSNAAVVLGGASPPGVNGLTATIRADGVALHWNTDRGAETAVRLHRKLVAAVGVSGLPLNNGSEKGKSASRPPSPEPVVRDLFVAFPEGHNSTGALDNTARFGETYAYSAQRLLQLQVDGRTLELDGPISPTIQVDVIDTFPPTVPSGLVAVAVSEPDSRPAIEAIDLSWLPDTESDLAGYIVYRSETQDGRSENWVRVSGAKPVEEPAFHDTKVRAGRTYRYAVSAIDLTGHESKKSVETEESVPEP